MTNHIARITATTAAVLLLAAPAALAGPTSERSSWGKAPTTDVALRSSWG